MVIGYNIVGEFQSTGLFRQLPLAEVPTLQQWLGPSAIEAVDSLLQRGPPRFHEDILRITQEEQTAGFCGPFLSRAEVDAQFGKGQWKPLERFLIQQPDGKQRVIDNARRTGHNGHTSMLETITIQSTSTAFRHLLEWSVNDWPLRIAPRPMLTGCSYA